MAFGFPAYHEETFPMPTTKLESLIKRVFLLLGWDFLDFIEDRKWSAKVPSNWRSWGERITVEALGSDQIRVRSNCSLRTQCVDWRKNAWNVKRFRQVMEALIMNGKSG